MKEKQNNRFYIASLISIFIFLFFATLGILNSGNPNPFGIKAQTPSPMVTVTPVLSSGECHARFVDPKDSQAVLPDSTCTPGEADPAVTQDNIQETICVAGYSTSVRPSSSYTNALKKEQIIRYGYTDTDMSDYEEDHLISLQLGGSPKSALNLWPEPHEAPNEKDVVENYLHKQVCNGSMTLVEAQHTIATDWYSLYLIIKKQ